MALSQEEMDRLTTLIESRKQSNLPVAQNTGPGFGQQAKDVGIGIAKGVGSTINNIAAIGRPVLGALDPTKTTAGYTPDAGAMFSEENLKADNTQQKVGKAVEFAAEVLFPLVRTSKGTKVVGASFDGIGSRIRGLSDDVVDGGVNVKDKLIDMIGGLDDKTKTALQRTPRDVFDNFFEKGKLAMADDRNRTPLELVGDSVATALKEVKDKASAIGAEKASLIKLPEPFKGKGIQQFNEGLQSFLNNRNLIENDKTVVKQIVSEFKKLGATPTKGQVDKFIDFAQDSLYAGEKNLTLPVSNKTTGGLKNLIGQLNTNLKDQLPDQYSKLNDEYSRLAELTRELNTKLGKASGNAGALVKRLFSPSDARTKELFEALEKETGQDFFRDARLAKFVMETLGDTRSTSLLEELPSTAGVIKAGYDMARTKLDIPIKAAEGVIKKNGL